MLEEHYSIALPREMLVEFSKVVQALTEKLDREVRADEIFDALLAEYVVSDGPYRLLDYDLSRGEGDSQRCAARLEVPDGEVAISGVGSGPIEAFVNGMVTTLNEPLNIVDYSERAMATGKDAKRDLHRRGGRRRRHRLLRHRRQPKHHHRLLRRHRLGGKPPLERGAGPVGRPWSLRGAPSPDQKLNHELPPEVGKRQHRERHQSPLRRGAPAPAKQKVAAQQDHIQQP